MTEIKVTGLLGSVQSTSLLDEVKHDGVKSTFRNGVLYRYPGRVPMLEVQGSHYEMGLQYAVLLHDELKRYMENLERVMRWLMARDKTPLEIVLEKFSAQAVNIMSRLPERFVDELKGVAEGTGLTLEQVAIPALDYDIFMGMGCTGVLMKTAKGGIIHGRNNDTAGFGGETLGPSTIIVRHKSPGYHTVTHIEFPFFFGVETGYNDQGLSFSEETLNVVNPNPDGNSLIYLIRTIMEECDNLDSLPEYFNRYPVIGAYGTVWSDRKAGRGLVAELTPTAWEEMNMQEPLLWNFNHLYSETLLPQQKPRVNLNPDLDREAVASTFTQKAAYEVNDAIDFLGLQIGPDGLDYSHCGLRVSVCNKSATQTVVFDPDSLDFYVGTGVYYAARQNIYHFFDDFTKPPVLFRQAAMMKPAVVEIARIHNLLCNNDGYRDAYLDLAHKYNDDAQVHFMAAYYSFLSRTLPEHADQAFTAFQLAPQVGTYRLFAGLAALLQGEYRSAIELLEPLKLHETERPLEPIRLYSLQKAWQEINPEKSAFFAAELDRFQTDLGAANLFETTWKPLIDPVS